MEVQVIDFIPPLVGLEGSFNTFRLGGKMGKVLTEGQEVFLMNGKSKVVFGWAVVERVETGTLEAMCALHASANHLELANDPLGAPERLFKYIQKIYGPHIAPPNKRTCVVYLRRLE